MQHGSMIFQPLTEILGVSNRLHFALGVVIPM
jgi:hypothetical protein